MKILHTADWHLGKRLEYYSRLDEQREVLNEICEIAEQENVDAVVVAGDLFDNFNPSSEATELLYSTLHRLSANGTRAVIAIAGNHDSPERIEVPDALARVCGIIFIGYPSVEIRAFKTAGGIEVTKTAKGFFELRLPRYDFPLRVIHTPYANEQRLKTYLGVEDEETALRTHLQQHWHDLASQYCDTNGFNLLVSHLYFMKKGGEMPEEPDDERPILHIGGASAIFSEAIPPQMQYVALGHLHRYQVIDTLPCPIVYSSSPLAYSFAEANQTKQIVLLDCQQGALVSYSPISLQKGRRLLRYKCSSVEEGIEWLTQNQESLVQLTVVSDNFLEASDKKRLHDVHSGLIQLIPEVSSKIISATGSTTIDLTNNVEELFISYFEAKKGQKPSSGILELLKEVVAIEPS